MEIGGDTVGLQSALGDVNKKASSLSNEMREVERALKLDPTNTELLAQKAELLAKQVDVAKEKLKALKDVQGQVEQQFKSGQIGEEAYRAFQREVAVAEANVGRLENELQDTGKTMTHTAADADKLSDGIEKAGKTADDSGGKLQKLANIAKKVGAAAAAALAAIGTAAVSAAKKLWDMSNDVAAAGDNIDKTSQKIGISAESYQEWGYVFERCGANVDNLQGSMKKLSGVIIEAGKGSKSAKEKLAAVGLTIDDLNGKSQDEQLSIVIAALQSMESGAERTAAATALLGNSAVDMAAVLNTSAKETQALKDEAREYGMVMSNDAVAASAAFEDSLTRVNHTISGVKSNMVGELLPGISLLMDGFADLIAGKDTAGEKIEQGVSQLVQRISSLVPKFLSMISSISSAVLKNAPKILKSLAKGIIDAWPELTTVVTGIIGQLADDFVGLLPEIAETQLTIIRQVIESLTAMLPTLLPQLTAALMKILQTIVDNLPLLLQAGLELVKGLVQGVIAAIPVLIDALPKLIRSVVDFILESIPQLIQAWIQLFKSFVQALPQIIKQIVAVIPEIIKDIIDALMDNLPLIVQAGIDLLTALVTDLPTIINAIVGAIPIIIDKVLSALTDAIPQLIDAGITLFISIVENLPAIISGIIAAIPKIISGLINALLQSIPKIAESGIKLIGSLVSKLPQIIYTIVSKIPEIISNIVSAFGSLISKMAEIGVNMIKGLWEGIKSMGSWLGDRCKDFGNAWLNGFKTIFGIHSPSTLFRDEIGKNLALGLGEGFIDNMDKVRRQMTAAVPTKLDVDPVVMTNISQTAAQLGQSAAEASQQYVVSFNIGTFNNRTENDLQEILDYAGQYFATQMKRRSVIF